MADSSSHSFDKTHLQDPNLTSIPPKPPKSKFTFTRYFFSKSLIIILVLLVFSFFPSQVPEFFNKTTIITKVWELIYLLVIGIAVCYGLFSRKMDRVHITDELAHSDDNIGPKETYLSGISHISSIFEDGFQNSYGFDEKQVFDESKGSSSRFPEFGKSDGKKLNQCFLGESMVVIDDENYVLEQLGKSKSSNRNKPLCLPIRSLGSKSLDSATVKSGDDRLKNGKFRGLVPIKLEEKFKEADFDPPTPLNWHSKSMRLGKKEEMCSTEVNETSRFRPLSVGVFDFEGLNSQSTRLNEDLKGETPLVKSKSQRFGVGTSEMNTHLSSKEIVKDSGKIKGKNGAFDSNDDALLIKSRRQRSTNVKSFDHVLGKEETLLGSSDLSPKPAPVANTYKRGKSVRTNRPTDRVLGAKVEIFPGQTDEKIEKGLRTGANTTNVKLDEARNVCDNLSDAEPHSGEVDRKADEFIAKFREQIRLQRAASVRRLNLW